MKVIKSLVFCFHGLSVKYEITGATALPTSLCGHSQATWGPGVRTVKQVIGWVEGIKQPKWGKTIRFWKFQLSLSKYP